MSLTTDPVVNATQASNPPARQKLEDAIALAKRRGATATRIWLNRNDDLNCSYEAGKPKSCSSATRTQYSIEVVAAGRRGSASGNDLAAMEEMVARAVTLAQQGSVAHFSEYPAPRQYLKVRSFSPAVEGLTLTDLHEAAAAMSDRLKRHDADLFVESSAYRSVWQGMMATSSGQFYEKETTLWQLGAGAQLTRGTDMLFAGTGRSWRELNAFYNTDQITSKVIEDLEHGREVVPSPQGKVKVFIPAEHVGSMLWPIFMGTNGRNVVKGDSPLRGKLGQQVLDSALTILDDPHLDYCHSGGEIDADGVPAKPMTIFDRGVLKSFLYDWDTAHLAGTDPTGHNGCQPWSACIAPGTHSTAELMASIEDGLLIKFLMGFGQGNIMNGDFSCNVGLGYRVQNGKITGRVKNAMVAGNLYELLSRNVLVGREVDPMHRHPPIVLDGINVSS